MRQSFWAEYALLDGECAEGVLIEVADGRFSAVTAGQPRPHDDDDVTVLEGVTLPGFANAHSHAFHRALRGRTHGDGGTFWTWRERMYTLAARLDPDNYRRLATAVFAEMVLAGVTCVGEFHYVHHRPGGAPYQDPNAMGTALIEAAATAGLRITLLDTCYLAGGLGPDGHLPLAPEQLRFGDGSAERWAERVRSRTTPPGHAKLGAAIHSVRAVPGERASEGSQPTPSDFVPADQSHVDAGSTDARAGGTAAAAGRIGPDPDPSPLRVVAEVARQDGLPLHVHLSEQPDENTTTLAWYGLTPTALLAREGALGEQVTAVHAVHLTDDDIALLGEARAGVCACPSTEADLADGIGPFPQLMAAGARLCLGSDQHAHTDLAADARRLEQHERLRSGRRGTFAPAELARIATELGHISLGWPDAGRIAPGQRADLVAVRLDTVRTAGARPDQILLAASAEDVHAVVVDGTTVVREGRHRLGDIGAQLTEIIAELWNETPAAADHPTAARTRTAPDQTPTPSRPDRGQPAQRRHE